MGHYTECIRINFVDHFKFPSPIVGSLPDSCLRDLLRDTVFPSPIVGSLPNDTFRPIKKDIRFPSPIVGSLPFRKLSFLLAPLVSVPYNWVTTYRAAATGLCAAGFRPL